MKLFCLFTQFALFCFFSILHTILIQTDGGGNKLNLNTLNSIVEANQFGMASRDSRICNHYNCQHSDLQPRSLCSFIKPMCPILRFSCRLCKFYLPGKTCTKTCQTSRKYCGSAGCMIESAPEDTSSSDSE